MGLLKQIAKAVLVLTAAFVLLLLLAKITTEYAVGYFARKELEKGTGCKFSLFDPSLSVFALRFEASRMSLRCPAEPPEQGVYVKKAEISVRLLPLLRKRLVIQEANVEGARIWSGGEDSAFHRFIKFVDEDEPKRAHWHGFITADWKVELRRLRVNGTPVADEMENIMLQYGDVRLSWSDVSILMNSIAEKSFRIEARSKRFRLNAGDEIDLGSLEGAATITPQRMLFDYARLAKAEAGGQFLEGRGELQFRGERNYNLHFSGTAGPGHLSSFASAYPVIKKAGVAELTLEASMSGPFEEPLVEGVFSAVLEGGQEELSPLMPRSLKGLFSFDTQHLAVREIRADKLLTKAAVDLAFGGRAEARFELFEGMCGQGRNFQGHVIYEHDSVAIPELSGQNCSLQAVLGLAAPFLQDETRKKLEKAVSPGSLFSLALNGNWSLKEERGQGQGNLSLSGITAGAIELSSASAALRLNEQAITVEPATIKTNLGETKGSVQINSARELRGRFTSDSLELSNISAVAEALPGMRAPIKGELEIGGTLSAPEYELHSLLTLIPVSGGEPVPAAIEVSGSVQATEFSAELFAGKARIDGDLQWANDNLFHVDAVASELPLAPLLRPWLPDVSGELSASLSYAGPLKTPLDGSGELRASRIRIGSAAAEVSNAQPVHWRLEAGKLNFGESVLSVGEHVVTLTGWLERESGWHAKLEGAWDAAALLPALEGIEHAGGTIRADLAVEGPLKKPLPRGDITLSGGSLTFSAGDFFFAANNVNAAANVDGENVTMSRISGQMAEGTFNGSGYLTHAFGDDRHLSITADFDDMELQPVENFLVRLRASLHLDKAEESAFEASGEVVIKEGAYENIINLRDILERLNSFVRGMGARKLQTRARSAEGPAKSSFSIRLRTDRPIIVDTNVVQTEVKANLRITGSERDPKLDGDFQTLGGTFGLQTAQFEIVSGRIIFSRQDPELDPRLDIVGETVLGEAGNESRVRLAIGGTLTKPDVVIRTEGGLNEREVLSMFKLGPGRMTLLESERGPKRSYRELLSPGSEVTLQQRLSGLTGFSSVQVGSTFSATTGETVPVVYLERPLPFGFGLNLQSELSSVAASEASASYDLTQDFALELGWREAPTTDNPESSSGSVQFGIRYTDEYPSLTLLPPPVLRLFGAERP